MLFIAVEDFTSVIQMSVNEQQTSCLMTGARNIEMSVALVFVDSTSVPPHHVSAFTAQQSAGESAHQ